MTYTYEPPRSNLPAGISTGRVYGTLLLAVDDGVDSGILTDAKPALGKITFTPSTSHVSHMGTMVGLETRTAVVSPTGFFEIDLVATSNQAPETNWSYNVKVDVPGFNIGPFQIQVAGGSNEAIDSLIPRAITPTTVYLKGDQGDKGDMSIVGLNVFVDVDGDLAIDDTQVMYWGTGNPNGVLSKPRGSLYVDRMAATNWLYKKNTDTGNTGWVVA